MPAGRPRKDSAYSRATGDTGHKGTAGYDRPEVTAPVGAPDCPQYLKGRAREWWHELIGMLVQIPQMLSIVDGSLVADLASVLAQKETLEIAQQAQFDEAEERIREEAKTEKPKPKPIKLTRRISVAQGLVIAEYRRPLDALRMRANVLRDELGLSPKARSSMRLPSSVASMVSKDPARESFFGPAGGNARRV